MASCDVGQLSIEVLMSPLDILTPEESDVVVRVHRDIGDMVHMLFQQEITIPIKWANHKLEVVTSGYRLFLCVFKTEAKRLRFRHTKDDIDFSASKLQILWRSNKMSPMALEILESKMKQFVLDGDDVKLRNPTPTQPDKFDRDCAVLLAVFEESHLMIDALRYLFTRPCYHAFLYGSNSTYIIENNSLDYIETIDAAAAIVRRQHPLIFHSTNPYYFDTLDDTTNGNRQYRLTDALKKLSHTKRFANKKGQKLLKHVKTQLTTDQINQTFVSGSRCIACLILHFPKIFQLKQA
jgi:hypothetical protein